MKKQHMVAITILILTGTVINQSLLFHWTEGGTDLTIQGVSFRRPYPDSRWRKTVSLRDHG